MQRDGYVCFTDQSVNYTTEWVQIVSAFYGIYAIALLITILGFVECYHVEYVGLCIKHVCGCAS